MKTKTIDIKTNLDLLKKYRNSIFEIFENTEIFDNIKLNFSSCIKDKMINNIHKELEKFYEKAFKNGINAAYDKWIK
jgi:hypothetical protein